MNDSEVELWCQKNNWSKPRQLELGIWVAYPPGGYIETPLPLQMQKPKLKLVEDILDFIILSIVTATMFAIAVIMSPCFLESIISRRRNKSFK